MLDNNNKKNFIKEHEHGQFFSCEKITIAAGTMSIGQRVKMFQEAGKKLVEHRCMCYPSVGTDGEEIDTSIFGKRYYDNIDLAELRKKHALEIEKLEQKITKAQAKKNQEKAEIAKAEKAELEQLRKKVSNPGGAENTLQNDTE